MRFCKLVRTSMMALSVTLLVSCSAESPSSKIGEGPAAAPSPNADYEGYLEIVDARGFSGWVWDRKNPDAVLKVEITYDGDKRLNLNADKLRSDLVEHKKGNGKHGFDCKLPAELKDGKEHVVRAKVAGSDFELTRSPRTLGALPLK